MDVRRILVVVLALASVALAGPRADAQVIEVVFDPFGMVSPPPPPAPVPQIYAVPPSYMPPTVYVPPTAYVAPRPYVPPTPPATPLTPVVPQPVAATAGDDCDCAAWREEATRARAEARLWRDRYRRCAAALRRERASLAEARRLLDQASARERARVPEVVRVVVTRGSAETWRARAAAQWAEDTTRRAVERRVAICARVGGITLDVALALIPELSLAEQVALAVVRGLADDPIQRVLTRACRALVG